MTRAIMRVLYLDNNQLEQLPESLGRLKTLTCLATGGLKPVDYIYRVLQGL